MFGIFKKQRRRQLELKKIAVFEAGGQPTTDEAHSAIQHVLKYGNPDEVLAAVKQHVEDGRPVDLIKAHAVQPDDSCDAKRTIADIDNFVARDNPRSTRRGYQCVTNNDGGFAFGVWFLLYEPDVVVDDRTEPLPHCDVCGNNPAVFLVDTASAEPRFRRFLKRLEGKNVCNKCIEKHVRAGALVGRSLLGNAE